MPKRSPRMSRPCRTTTCAAGSATPRRRSASSASTVARSASSPTRRYRRRDGQDPVRAQVVEVLVDGLDGVEVVLGEREGLRRVRGERVGEAEVHDVVPAVVAREGGAPVADGRVHARHRVRRLREALQRPVDDVADAAVELDDVDPAHAGGQRVEDVAAAAAADDQGPVAAAQHVRERLGPEVQRLPPRDRAALRHDRRRRVDAVVEDEREPAAGRRGVADDAAQRVPLVAERDGVGRRRGRREAGGRRRSPRRATTARTPTPRRRPRDPEARRPSPTARRRAARPGPRPGPGRRAARARPRSRGAARRPPRPPPRPRGPWRTGARSGRCSRGPRAPRPGRRRRRRPSSGRSRGRAAG